MSDIHALRGPAGQLRDRGSFVGSPRSAPASLLAELTKNRRSREKDLTCASPRGPLAMSDDELADVILLAHSQVPSPRRRLPAEDPEEAYWRLFQEEVELIRELRAIHPTASQLAMSAEEITSYYRRLTPSPRTEAQRQADIKIVSREQPGRKSRPNESERPDKYLALWRECLEASGPNTDRADKSFIKKATRPKEDGGLGVEKKTARNQLYRLKRGAKK